MVSEALLAIPWIHVTPQAGGDAQGGFESSVEFRRNQGDLPNIDPYDSSTTTLPDVKVLAGSSQVLPISRLGVQMRLGGAENAGDSGQAFLRFRMQATIAALLARLDTMVARGSGSGKPVEFKGLSTLSSESGRQANASQDLAADLTQALLAILPRSGGVGDGPHCLLGGPRVLRRLMLEPGDSHMKGWKRDLRTGRLVYHWEGLPFYRVNVDETTGGRLYTANLGVGGLQMAHTDGTRDSFGLTFRDLPGQAAGMSDTIVSGGFALLLSDPAALFEVNGIAV